MKSKYAASSNNAYSENRGSPLRSRSFERDRRSMGTEEAYERSR